VRPRLVKAEAHYMLHEKFIFHATLVATFNNHIPRGYPLHPWTSKGPQLHECMSFRSGKSSHGHLEGVLEGFFEAAEKNVTSVFEV